MLIDLWYFELFKLKLVLLYITLYGVYTNVSLMSKKPKSCSLNINNTHTYSLQTQEKRVHLYLIGTLDFHITSGNREGCIWKLKTKDNKVITYDSCRKNIIIYWNKRNSNRNLISIKAHVYISTFSCGTLPDYFYYSMLLNYLPNKNKLVWGQLFLYYLYKFTFID